MEKYKIIGVDLSSKSDMTDIRYCVKPYIQPYNYEKEESESEFNKELIEATMRLEKQNTKKNRRYML